MQACVGQHDADVVQVGRNQRGEIVAGAFFSNTIGRAGEASSSCSFEPTSAKPLAASRPLAMTAKGFSRLCFVARSAESGFSSRVEAAI